MYLLCVTSVRADVNLYVIFSIWNVHNLTTDQVSKSCPGFTSITIKKFSKKLRCKVTTIQPATSVTQTKNKLFIPITAYPSLMEAGNGGNGSGAETF